jgi:hypothetical protein
MARNTTMPPINMSKMTRFMAGGLLTGKRMAGGIGPRLLRVKTGQVECSLVKQYDR